MDSSTLSDFQAADPNTSTLDFLLLPEMEFTGQALEMVVECLRHVAGRALARSTRPIAGGVSITLIANREQRAQPINLSIDLGDTLLDALNKLGALTGMVIIAGSVGLLICSSDLAPAIIDAINVGPAPEEPEFSWAPYGREEWLRLIGFYPALAVSSNPAACKWYAAVLASGDMRIETAYRLAAQIVGFDDCGCVVQVPFPPPAFVPIPGID